jgi:hypothetical protein
MTTALDLHQQAMELAQDALTESEQGHPASAHLLYAQALPLEIDAASQMEKIPEAEPTRSILYLSAATLAYHVGDMPLAKKLIGEALSGDPPPRVEHDLFELLENLDTGLQLTKNVDVLDGSQLLLSIAGGVVSNGRAPYRSFVNRSRAAVNMMEGIGLLHQGHSFVGGVIPNNRQRSLTPIISAPRPGSFQVIIELAQREDVPQSFLTSGEEIVDQVIAGVNLVQEEKVDDLRALLGNDDFYHYFVQNARLLAPDGRLVGRVELSSPRREAVMTKRPQEIVIPPFVPTPREGNYLVATSTLRGVLIEASVKSGQWVWLKPENRRPQKLWVSEAIDDLVRNYFDLEVEVRIGTREGREEIVSFYPVEE